MFKTRRLTHLFISASFALAGCSDSPSPPNQCTTSQCVSLEPYAANNVFKSKRFATLEHYLSRTNILPDTFTDSLKEKEGFYRIRVMRTSDTQLMIDTGILSKEFFVDGMVGGFFLSRVSDYNKTGFDIIGLPNLETKEQFEGYLKTAFGALPEVPLQGEDITRTILLHELGHQILHSIASDENPAISLKDEEVFSDIFAYRILSKYGYSDSLEFLRHIRFTRLNEWTHDSSFEIDALENPDDYQGLLRLCKYIDSKLYDEEFWGALDVIGKPLIEAHRNSEGVPEDFEFLKPLFNEWHKTEFKSPCPERRRQLFTEYYSKLFPETASEIVSETRAPK